MRFWNILIFKMSRVSKTHWNFQHIDSDTWRYLLLYKSGLISCLSLNKLLKFLGFWIFISQNAFELISLFYKNAKVSTRDWTDIILVDSERHWGSVSNKPKIIKICLGKYFGGKSDTASPLPRPCWVWKCEVFIWFYIFHRKYTIEIIFKYLIF